MAPPSEEGILRLGDIRLESGGVLRDAKIVYLALGRLNASRDNAIVIPTYFTGTHKNYLPLIGPNRALDPARYFIVIPNMFGNGLSSSPSNVTHEAGKRFPLVTIYDNVLQQGKLIFDVLGVERVALVCGWSMGGMQAYQWAASFPSRVERLLPFCAAARISPYNAVFLEGLKSAMLADFDPRAGDGARRPTAGIRAFAHVYAGWAYSHEFYRDELYRSLGYGSIAALLRGWEEEHLALDPRDLLAMLETWEHADISARDPFQGDFASALSAISADTILMPCSTDRYFPEVDAIYESAFIPRCEVRTLHSAFGHCALSPGRVPAALDFLDRTLTELLGR